MVLLIEEENKKVIDLCDSISKKDNRVKLIIIKNQTVKRARNLGISYAKGKYIAFLEPGDYLEPRAYEVVYKAVLDDVNTSIQTLSTVYSLSHSLSLTLSLSLSHSVLSLSLSLFSLSLSLTHSQAFM